MRKLIDAYGAAVATVVTLERKTWLETHPTVGAPLRAARQAETRAREALDDAIAQAAALVAQALPDVESIDLAAPTRYADDPSVTEGYRANFTRPHNARRAFTLKDARPRARYAARLLRQAWNLLDPTN